MFKKFGVLGLMLSGGLLFIHPSVGSAQDRYGSGSYYYSNQHYDRGHDRDYRDYERQRVREEREARKWREKELRERERWERRNFRNSSGYRDGRYRGYGYGNSYRPY